jgi:hypothetical protein
MILDADNPYIAPGIIHLWRQAKDPLNLSDLTKINLQLVSEFAKLLASGIIGYVAGVLTREKDVKLQNDMKPSR